MELKDLTKGLIEQRLTDCHVALPAKIKFYNPQTLKASIQILAKSWIKNQAVDLPEFECRVAVLKAGSFIIRPPYQVGDIVQVLFNESALDNLLIDGDTHEVGFSRRFSLDDAVIIGGLKTENQGDFSIENAGDLLIANVEKGSKIVLDAAGDITIKGGNIILGDGTDFVPLGNALNTWLKNHTHHATNGLTSGAIEDPPAPSNKVKVG